MKKIQRYSLIIGIIIALSIVYPVSAYVSYYSNNNQLSASHIPFAGTINPSLFSDAKGTQKVIIWSSYTVYKPIQDRPKVTLFAINVNYTKIPPFAVYESSTNGSVSYIGTLTQFNLTIDLTIRDGVNIVKELSDTISLNNKTNTLTVTKIITWHPPAPSLLDLLNPLAQKTYSLQERITDSLYMTNTSSPNGSGFNEGRANIYLKWVNLNTVFTIYSVIIILIAFVVTGIYTSNEYRKYSKMKGKNTSFLVYLKINFRGYAEGLRKTKQSNKNFKPQTLSHETLEKLEEIEKENSNEM